MHVTKNTGRYAMIHTAFFNIPVNFAFNLPHYVTCYMHNTGKEESKTLDLDSNCKTSNVRVRVRVRDFLNTKQYSSMNQRHFGGKT